MTQNTVEKRIELNAPQSRVWRAITDHTEFGEWFQVALEAPFKPGQTSKGRITLQGYQHLIWEAVIQKIEPESLFSLTWHPNGIDPNVDYTKETPTLVEFRLEAKGPGTTILTLKESGFDSVPEHRRFEAFRMNDQGWTAQMKNIENHVRSHG